MEPLIFDIEEQSIYAEMNVINSLLDCYFKEAMMTEYVSDDIIQEGVFGRAYDMTKEELHKYIEESNGSESNICPICAYKDDKMVYSDTWHDYKKDNCVHIITTSDGNGTPYEPNS